MPSRIATPASLLLMLLAATAMAAQTIDPPTRVGRVSEIAGKVSLRPIGSSEWTQASINYPLTTGDAVWAAEGSRAEVHLGAAALQFAPSTAIHFDSLSDRTTRVTVRQGSAIIRVRSLATDERFEVFAGGGRVVLEGDGSYRFDVTPDGKRGTVTVRSGKAEMISGYEAYPVLPGTSKTFTGVAKSPIAAGTPIPLDTWEAWADSLNSDEDSATAAKYVTRDLVGYDELDDYGDWNTNTEFGPVWQPRAVSVGWTPYRYGRWESIRPWGWTWLPEEPWGFATSHYGRWAELGGQWSWIPGSRVNRPVYAPAVVAFLNNGTALVTDQYSPVTVGWIPLGPGDLYYPSYPVTGQYLGAINSNNLPWSGWSFTAWSPWQNALNNQNSYYNLGRSNAIIFVTQTIFVGGYRIGSAALPFDSRDLPRTRPAALPTSHGRPILPVYSNRPRVLAEGPSVAPSGRVIAAPAAPSSAQLPSGRSSAPVTQPLVNPAYATGQRVVMPQAPSAPPQYSTSQPSVQGGGGNSRRASPNVTMATPQAYQNSASPSRQRAQPQTVQNFGVPSSMQPAPSRAAPVTTQPRAISPQPPQVQSGSPAGATRTRARPVGGGN